MQEIKGALAGAPVFSGVLWKRALVLLLPHLSAAGLVLYGLARILNLNSGTFVYTLDDPYIHLSMSEQIAQGGYGVNLNEFAAASSSILYPFLLAPASATKFHQFLPLVINLAAMLVTIEVIRRHILHIVRLDDYSDLLFSAIVTAIAAVSLNLVGLVFTGMEHSLHVAMVAATVYGLARFLDDGSVAWWFLGAVVIGPFVRYEGTAISLAVLCVLAVKGQRRLALVGLAGVVGGLGLYSSVLLAHGAGPLPSSVLVKSELSARIVEVSVDGVFFSLLAHIFASLSKRAGIVLLLSGVVAVLWVLLEREPSSASRRSSVMTKVLLVLIGAHVIAGRYGWFHRYEIYALVGAFMILLYVYRFSLRRALVVGWLPAASVTAVTVTFLILAGTPYLRSQIRDVPYASNNIFEQQYQIHRFISGYYQKRVAVNDLGWSSYRNDRYVLDLHGLGSRRARRLRSERSRLGWVGDLVESQEVEAAILYSAWYEDGIPAEWTKVAVLHLGRRRLTPAEAEVSFFATDSTESKRLRAALTRFRPTLPAGVRLEWTH